MASSSGCSGLSSKEPAVNCVSPISSSAMYLWGQGRVSGGKRAMKPAHASVRARQPTDHAVLSVHTPFLSVTSRTQTLRNSFPLQGQDTWAHWRGPRRTGCQGFLNRSANRDSPIGVSPVACGPVGVADVPEEEIRGMGAALVVRAHHVHLRSRAVGWQLVVGGRVDRLVGWLLGLLLEHQVHLQSGRLVGSWVCGRVNKSVGAALAERTRSISDQPGGCEAGQQHRHTSQTANSQNCC